MTGIALEAKNGCGCCSNCAPTRQFKITNKLLSDFSLNCEIIFSGTTCPVAVDDCSVKLDGIKNWSSMSYIDGSGSKNGIFCTPSKVSCSILAGSKPLTCFVNPDASDTHFAVMPSGKEGCEIWNS